MKIDFLYKKYQIFLILLTTIALLMAIVGWSFALYPDSVGTINLWLEVSTRSLLFFLGEGVNQTYKKGGYILKIAEFLSLLCAFGAILWGLFLLSYTKIIRWKISRLKGHLVVIGFDSAAKALTLAENKQGRTIVVIDDEYSLTNEDFCAVHNIFYVQGGYSDKTLLSSVATVKASHIIVATERDSYNLRIISQIRSLMRESKGKPQSIKAYIKIECNVFWREMAQSELLKRQQDHLEVVPFNLSVMAARYFTWHYPLYSYADIHNQQQIHTVLIGVNAYAESLIEKILTSYPYKNFSTPCFTLLVPDVTYAEKCFQNKYPEIYKHTTLKFIQHDVVSDVLTNDLLSIITETAPITAIFIFTENNDAALCQTINIRNELFRCTYNSFPLFIQMSHIEGMQNLIAMPNKVKNFQDVIVPYGVFNDICLLDFIEGPLEEIARQLHVEYENFRQSKIVPDDTFERKASLEEWGNLEETYRESNRRAIDHIPAKLATAGCFIPGGFSLNVPTSFQLVKSPEQLEVLSDLEQKSWSFGRYVNGWRAGEKRDNRRKVHNLLGKKYTELDEETKGYDRKQINVINEKVLNRDRQNDITIRHDHWIGLIGHNHISAEESVYIEEALMNEILPKLTTNHKEALFTIVTPLAPGSDLLMTTTVLNYLCQHKIPHRLLVIEAVPYDLLLDDYVNKDVTPSQKEAIETSRNNVLKRTSTDWIVSLIDEEKDYHQQTVREEGYEKVANYINTRCHSLIAVHREDSAIRKGGTAATLLNRPTAIQSNDVFWQTHFPTNTIEIDPQTKKVKAA